MDPQDVALQVAMLPITVTLEDGSTTEPYDVRQVEHRLPVLFVNRLRCDQMWYGSRVAKIDISPDVRRAVRRWNALCRLCSSEEFKPIVIAF